MAGNIDEVGDNNFDEKVLKSGIPVLVDFWAPWCGPCKSIAPVLEEIAAKYAGKVSIVKVNVDDNPRTPAQYGVRAIPNLVMFKGGQVFDKLVGAVPPEQLTVLIDKAIA